MHSTVDYAPEYPPDPDPFGQGPGEAVRLEDYDFGSHRGYV
jgi:hypothetical protein